MSLATTKPYAVYRDDLALVQTLSATRGQPIERRVRQLVETGMLALGAPGSGATWPRFRRLAEVAAEDLSLARLAEGHTDAVAILAEAGLEPASHATLYGVWVAGAPLAGVSSPGGCQVSGTRAFCSGSGMLDRALVTARVDEAVLLSEIDARAPCITVDPASWPAVGMADTRSFSIEFASAESVRQLGPPGFYETRPGFWNGSVNVAACWYGGALGLARALGDRRARSPWERVLQAEIYAVLTQMRTTLSAGARDMDSCPSGSPLVRELRALSVRDLVYRGCVDVIAAAAELGGTEKSTHDSAQARRLADLPVYLRQHHPMRDRERIGQILELLGSNNEEFVCL